MSKNTLISWFKKKKEISTSASKPEPKKKQTAPKSPKSSKTAKKPPKKARSKPEKTSAPKWDVSEFSVEPAEGKTRFHDLGICDELMHAISDLGFKYCSPIQAQILPLTLQGRDATGKAQTGTGKTAAFLITIMDDFIRHPITWERYLGEPRAVIVAPTRELAMQIAEDAKELGKYTNLNVVALFGGMPYDKQHKKLNSGFVDIVVATPGRLIDFMTRGDIHLDRVETLILDEADHMLDMGFIPQVKRIVRATPRLEDRQTLFFSATFTQDILNLAKQWTFDPVEIEIEPETVATDSVDQRVYMVSTEDKFKLLVNILRQPEANRVIIFANRRDQVQKLYTKVRKAGFKAGVLSGEITQQKRTKALENFRTGELHVIVATDVMGRGIHIDDVSHVVNYNLPQDPEDYVHRIGRTGRGGATGISITLACETESYELPRIEELLGEKLSCELPPDELMK